MIRPHTIPRDPEEESGAGGGTGQQALPLDKHVGDPPKDDPPKPDPKIAELEQRVAQSDQRFQELQQLLQRNRPQPQNQQTYNPEELNAEFFKDPVRNTAALAQHIANQTLAQERANRWPNEVKAAEAEARQKINDPEIFDKYYPQIKAQVEQYAPEARVDARIWTQAARSVIGEHAEEVVKMRQNRNKGPALPSLRAGQSPKETNELTDEQKWVAENVFDMTADQYKQAEKDYEAQRKPLSPNPRVDALKSPWAKVVTFDSNKNLKPRPQKKTA